MSVEYSTSAGPAARFIYAYYTEQQNQLKATAFSVTAEDLMLYKGKEVIMFAYRNSKEVSRIK